MTLDALYQKLILAHNQCPHNFGELPGATHRGRAQDALCGDDLEIALFIQGSQVVKATFYGEACVVTKASASLLTDWLVGQEIASLPASFEAFQALLADPEHPKVPNLGALNELQPVGAFPARRGNACLPWIATLRAVGLFSSSNSLPVR